MRNKITFFVISALILVFYGCATKKVQYAGEFKNYLKDDPYGESQIDYQVFLVGDAGNAMPNDTLSSLSVLEQDLAKASDKSSVIFLGDNIYPNGMPSSKKEAERKLAEYRLKAQTDILKGFKGQPIFIPGNHDWRHGIKGLERQQKFIEEQLNSKDVYFPEAGCPLEKIKLTDDIVVIAVDSQWFLEDWDKNPGINENCPIIKTRDKFFTELEDLIKKNAAKTTILAVHHPLYSNGPHGGQFTVKDNFFTFKSRVPLPVIGTFMNTLRKTSGASPQDLQNKIYNDFILRVSTLAQESENLILVSGHEHNLQYIHKNNTPQIISGSGSKTSGARAVDGGQFSYGGLGYAVLDVYKNGSVWVSYFATKGNKKELLYRTEVLVPEPKDYEGILPEKIEQTYTSSIYTKKQTHKSKFYEWFWGKHYRKYYSEPVTVPGVNLDTIFGGLHPVRKGGGHQSNSLRLENSLEKQYVMRALKKSATKFLQAVAFKKVYMEKKMRGTLAEKILLDFYTTAYPYAPFIVGDLSDAVDVLHANPKLYFIPKQKALGIYNNSFGGELYMIEERVSDNHEEVATFGGTDKIISTDDLLKNLQKSDNYKVDEPTYIKARLFDMLLGDWDRHEDQWRWAEFKIGKQRLYKAIPRDRDQVFSKFDGVLVGAVTRLVPALRMMQSYDEELRNVKWFNYEPFPLDKALILQSDWDVWEAQAKHIQDNLTDEVIEKAFKNLPENLQDQTIEEIKVKLKGRRANMVKIAREYFEYLNKFPVLKGTDKDEWITIERLGEGKTRVTIHRKVKGEKEALLLDRVYHKDLHKQIWIYGLGDDDRFEVIGDAKASIPIRLIGGEGVNIYDIKNKQKIKVYQLKDQKFKVEQKNLPIHKTNDYDLVAYNYKKTTQSIIQILPSVGSNPDDGFKVGVNASLTRNGFKRNPFSSKHNFRGEYYFATDGFELEYNGEIASILGKWNLGINSLFTSPNYSINYFGTGNDTRNEDSRYGKNFNRVKLKTIELNPSLIWKGRFGASFKVGPTYQLLEVEDTKNRFVNIPGVLPEEVFENQSFVGGEASYSYDNVNNKAIPTLGMHFNFTGGWKSNISTTKKGFAYINSTLSVQYKLVANGRLVLASKVNGALNFGNNYEFYHANSIGADNGLRGFRRERFTGKRTFYQNTDLRFQVGKSETSLIPITYGIFGGYDYGRVWVKDDTSNNWHDSYGGGLWVSGADVISVNLSLFNSADGARFAFGVGLGF
ncbi:metallophosphoesterase [Aureivirga sp. CE67]|uniref:metallophosphoesterase n=1 Tax=Aureivirga sp. CE67 TaxID=1788983 RepID=UPI0018C9B7A7|nr:metallophosphoesterase [Aureivirga sp. CE67]